MEYREFSPVAALAPFVDRLWTLRGRAGEAGAGSQAILPDGRPELVIHFGDPFDRASGPERFVRQPRVLIAGQLTGQLVLRPTGTISMLGVRFHPFGAAGSFDGPLHHLTGLTPGLDEVSRPLSASLERVRSRTGDVRAAVSLVQEALVEHLRTERLDGRVRHAALLIEARGGVVSIEALAAAVSMSRRHLERRFLDVVGIGPKRLARVIRFQRALHALESGDRGAGAAAACGYADQSHFVREFRDLAGCSPSEHLLRQGELTGFFLTGDPRSALARRSAQREGG